MAASQEVFVNTVVANYVPQTYTRWASSGVVQLILKGQLNKIRVRPRIISEHVESSREILDVVESGVIAGQIFKASQDNINGIQLTLESAAGASFDNFEGYANSAALQAVWVKGGTSEAALETTVVNSGSQSMALPAANNDGVWTDTISTIDYTEYTFDFAYQQTHDFANQQISFFIGDGTNTKSLLLNISTPHSWASFQINEAAMSVTADDLTVTTPDMTAITKIGFRVDKKKVGSSGYVDDILTVAPPGTIGIKLWNLGPTLPVGDGGSFDLANDATQYTEIGDRGINDTVVSTFVLNLEGGKKLYDITEFVAGAAREIPANTTLHVSNYYAITLHYVDTDVSVYGPDTTFSIDYYTNGYAFSTTAENADITKINGAAGSGDFSDLMFAVFSTQNVYVTGYTQIADQQPGNNARTNVFLEDSDMNISDISKLGGGAVTEVLGDLGLRPMFLDKGGKFELYYSDDFTDSVMSLALTVAYLYIPPTVNG